VSEETLTNKDWKMIVLAVDDFENEYEGDWSALESKLCRMFPDIIKELEKETKSAGESPTEKVK
jgi:hypothetical protein